MKRNRSFLFGVLCTALLLLPTSGAWAQNAKPPTQLTYQGFLTDANGLPLGNTAPVNKTVIFRIYDALTGGTLKWSSQQVVTVDKGYFSVLLGQGSAVGTEPFNADLTGVFAGSSTVSDRYLELTADGTTIAPRLRFLPAPYAILARSATELLDPVTGASSLSISGGNLNVGGSLNVSSLTASGNLSANGITASGNFSAANLSGNGANLTSLNASQITSGTLANARTTATSSRFANTIASRDTSGNSYFGDNSTGGAGIGASSEGTELRLHGNGFQHYAIRNNQGVLHFGTSSVGDFIGATMNSYLALNGSGNVGIGTTAPAGRLNLSEASGTVANPNSGTLVLDHENSGGASSIVFRSRVNRTSDYGYIQYQDAAAVGGGGEAAVLTVGTSNDSDDHIALMPAGNVGIGTTTPAVKLSVQANGEAIRITRSNGRSVTMYREDGDFGFYVRGGTSQTGSDKTVRFDGDNNWDYPSDRRLKKGIVDAEPMLDRAMQVQVRRYRWKEDPDDGKLVLGVIAQELQPLFPHMVKEREDHTTKEKTLSVGYGDFATIAIKSLQEFKQRHDAEVADLKKQIAELKRANEKLQAGNQERDARLATIEQFIANHSRTVAPQTASVRDGN
jgi:hypothetical protein